jgi:hypothetical protein
MSIVMSEDHATTDINVMRRNLSTPRSGQSPAEYARAVHAESLERHAKWPERIMLFAAGVCAGGVLLSSILPR